MRWDRLFEDLEAQFDELALAESAAELADRTRVATGTVRLTQRLAGALGQRVGVSAGAQTITGTLQRVGPDFVLLGGGGAGQSLIALDKVVAVRGLTATTGPQLTGVAMRLDLRRALRGVARDRAPVVVALSGLAATAAMASVATPARSGVSEVSGTIDRVGADFIEVAEHPPWEPRRASTVRGVALLPLPAIVSVQSSPLG